MEIKREAPFSLRLGRSLDKRLDAWARRAKRSKSSIAKQMIDEAERCWRYPGIGFRDTAGRRRAWIIGGLDIWELIWILQGFEWDVEKVLANHKVTRRQIDLARAYYNEFPEEIDEMIAWQRRPMAELQADFPHVQTVLTEG